MRVLAMFCRSEFAEGCIATFNKHHMFIKKDSELIRQEKRAETQQQDYVQTADLDNQSATPNVMQHVAMSVP